MCSDLVSDEPEPTSGRRRRSFDPTELTWNIDRLDERSLPLDGGFCPAADGEYRFSPFEQALINWKLIFNICYKNSDEYADT